MNSVTLETCALKTPNFFSTFQTRAKLQIRLPLQIVGLYTNTGELTLTPVRLSVELCEHKNLEAGTALSGSKRHQGQKWL